MQGMKLDFDLNIENASNLSIAYMIERALFQPPSKETVNNMIKTLEIPKYLNESITELYNLWMNNKKDIKLCINGKTKDVDIKLNLISKAEGIELENSLTNNIMLTYDIPAYLSVEEHHIIRDMIALSMTPYISFSTADTEIRLNIAYPIMCDDIDSSKNSSPVFPTLKPNLRISTVLNRISLSALIVKGYTLKRKKRCRNLNAPSPFSTHIPLDIKKICDMCEASRIEFKKPNMLEFGDSNSVKAELYCTLSKELSLVSRLNDNEIVAWCDFFIKWTEAIQYNNA